MLLSLAGAAGGALALVGVLVGRRRLGGAGEPAPVLQLVPRPVEEPRSLLAVVGAAPAVARETVDALLGAVRPVASARKRGDEPAPPGKPAGADETARLKEKLAGGAAGAREAAELKRKLRGDAPKPPSRPPSKPPSKPASASERPVLRPLPSEPAAPAPARAKRPETCRVGLWRGYIKAQFVAEIAGGVKPLASSPYFRWRKPAPPPQEREDVAAAHAALLAELAAAGWEPTGAQGEEWFALELRPRQEGSVSDERSGGSDGAASD